MMRSLMGVTDGGVTRGCTHRWTLVRYVHAIIVAIKVETKQQQHKKKWYQAVTGIPDRSPMYVLSGLNRA